MISITALAVCALCLNIGMIAGKIIFALFTRPGKAEPGAGMIAAREVAAETFALWMLVLVAWGWSTR